MWSELDLSTETGPSPLAQLQNLAAHLAVHYGQIAVLPVAKYLIRFWKPVMELVTRPELGDRTTVGLQDHLGKSDSGCGIPQSITWELQGNPDAQATPRTSKIRSSEGRTWALNFFKLSRQLQRTAELRTSELRWSLKFFLLLFFWMVHKPCFWTLECVSMSINNGCVWECRTL